MTFPPDMRALNICRLPDGSWQASLQTDEHAYNSFSIGTGVNPEAAVRDVCDRRAPAISFLD